MVDQRSRIKFPCGWWSKPFDQRTRFLKWQFSEIKFTILLFCSVRLTCVSSLSFSSFSSEMELSQHGHSTWRLVQQFWRIPYMYFILPKNKQLPRKAMVFVWIIAPVLWPCCGSSLDRYYEWIMFKWDIFYHQCRKSPNQKLAESIKVFCETIGTWALIKW